MISKLNFKENINNIFNNVAKRIYLSGKISKNLTISKIIVLKSVIAPDIDYCASTLFL